MFSLKRGVLAKVLTYHAAMNQTDHRTDGSGSAELSVEPSRFTEQTTPSGDGVMRLVFPNQELLDLWRERLAALA